MNQEYITLNAFHAQDMRKSLQEFSTIGVNLFSTAY